MIDALTALRKMIEIESVFDRVRALQVFEKTYIRKWSTCLELSLKVQEVAEFSSFKEYANDRALTQLGQAIARAHAETRTHEIIDRPAKRIVHTVWVLNIDGRKVQTPDA